PAIVVESLANGTITGRVTPPDDAVVAALAPALPAPPQPDIGAYLSCLGNVTAVDIRLCPELGLNIHGKGLYLVPFSVSDIRFITGKNVHHQLLAFVAARHDGWAARQPSHPAAL